METLPIRLFKESFGPFLKLLNEHDVKYQMHETRSGEVMASSGILEIILSPAMWGALATIVVMFIKSKHGRKVIITMKNDKNNSCRGIN